jgi:sodium-dependent dicarboxylate transporter 2/3/5
VIAFGLKQASALFVVGMMSLFPIGIHLGFASAIALGCAMIPIVIAILQGVATPGSNVLGLTMILQFVVSFGLILAVNARQNMVGYGSETFEAPDFIGSGPVLTVIGFVLKWSWPPSIGSGSVASRLFPATLNEFQPSGSGCRIMARPPRSNPSLC